MKEIMDVTLKKEELRRKLARLDVLETIYNKVVQDMQWNCLQYHQADDEHDSTWFTEYDEEEDSYNYERMKESLPVYEEVLDCIEKLMK